MVRSLRQVIAATLTGAWLVLGMLGAFGFQAGMARRALTASLARANETSWFHLQVSLSAFGHALKLGVSTLELDVQITEDAKPSPS